MKQIIKTLSNSLMRKKVLILIFTLSIFPPSIETQQRGMLRWMRRGQGYRGMVLPKEGPGSRQQTRSARSACEHSASAQTPGPCAGDLSLL